MRKILNIGIKAVFSILVLIIISVKSKAQENEKIKDSISSDFISVETMPEFPGGIKEFYKFYASNFITPEAVYKNKIYGKFYIQFMVNTDGSLSDFKIMKSLGHGVDEEVVRVLKICPKWIPATQNGVSVRLRYILPMTINKPIIIGSVK